MKLSDLKFQFQLIFISLFYIQAASKWWSGSLGFLSKRKLQISHTFFIPLVLKKSLLLSLHPCRIRNTVLCQISLVLLRGLVVTCVDHLIFNAGTTVLHLCIWKHAVTTDNLYLYTDITLCESVWGNAYPETSPICIRIWSFFQNFVLF